jgi:hypothetical protein
MMPDERVAADAMWDAMAYLGLVDARGGAEYERRFADQETVGEFAKAGWMVVGACMLKAAPAPELGDPR